MAELSRTIHVPASAEMAFAWCSRPAALQRLCPPWETLLQMDCQGGVADGGRVLLGVRRGRRIRVRQFRYGDHQPGRELNLQVTGFDEPYRWEMRAKPAGDSACTLTLTVVPEVAPGGRRAVDLGRLLDYQQRRLRDDLTRLAPFAGRAADRVVISGASGLVGSHLATFLAAGGHRVDRLVRAAPAQNSTDVHWNPAEGRIDVEALEDADVVVHLAGANIAARRWNDAYKREIRESRTIGTRLLSEALAGLAVKPRVLISASATGIYDTNVAEPMDESGSLGTGFLADLGKEWEAATQPAIDAGIRVVKLRIGVVLAARGGALEKMLGPFRMGLGGTLGNGRQYMSWIALDDLLGMIHFLMQQPDITGPINATSPQPATNHKFTKRLGRVLRRPTILRVPGPMLRLALGEFATILLRGDAQVLPTRIRRLGFEFLYPSLEGALRGELGIEPGD